MSFDHIQNVYRDSRKKRMCFSEVELRAKELIKSLVGGFLSYKNFALNFEKVRIEFYELLNINGQTTINEDTPLWLNRFFAYHFLDWYRYQQLKWHFREHPEELTDEIKERYARIQSMRYDERFLDACENVLKDLGEEVELKRL